MKGKSYSSKITSIGCALCTNCLDVIYCSVHLSFIVLSTYPKSAVTRSSRGLDLSPNNKRIGAWTLSDWRHIGQPIISHLNTYILYLQLWSNDLNSQHITNHQLGFKLFTVHSSQFTCTTATLHWIILKQYIKTNYQTIRILNISTLKLIIKRYKFSTSCKPSRLYKWWSPAQRPLCIE